MDRIKRLSKTVLEFMIFTIIMGLVISEFIGTTYAVMSQGNPDVIITIDEKGNMLPQQGNLFGNELWYPDKNGREGIIRIYNNYKSTKLTSLAVAVRLNSFDSNKYNEGIVFNAFKEHMRLTIKKGRWFQFGDTSIVSDQKLGELINGVTLSPQDQVSISAGNPLDLKYTMRMDEKAGNELEGLSAEVAFIIGTPLDSTPGGGEEPGGGDNPGVPETPGNPTGPPSVPTLIEEPEIKIPDIDGHWAHDCIIALIENNKIQGDEKGRIMPDSYLTRGEAAVLVGKALNLKPVDKAVVKYKDRLPTWAEGYINITSENYIFKGYPDGQFKANNNITREEMIAVLTRAFKLKLEDRNLELPFKDKNEIGNWALESVKSGYEDKVIVGYPDNTYKPNNKITRAEAFTIICKLLDYHNTHVTRVQ